MNPTPEQQADPSGDPNFPDARLLADHLWRAAQDREGYFGVHVLMAGAPKNLFYEGILTIGCGRGMGYSLPQLADRITRQVETDFGVPADRVKWAIRLLTPPPPQDHTADEGDDEALGRTEPKYAIGRTDLFRVETRGNVRVAVAVRAADLKDYFDGVMVHTRELVRPPRCITSFRPYKLDIDNL